MAIGAIYKSGHWYPNAVAESSRVLTQEAFDALTDDEKNNGTEYFVYDAIISAADADDILYDDANTIKDEIDELKSSLVNQSEAISTINNKLLKYDTFTYIGSEVSITAGESTVITLSDFSVPSGYSIASLPFAMLNTGLIISSANASGGIRIYNFSSSARVVSSNTSFIYLFKKK